MTQIDRRGFLTKVALGAAVAPSLWNAQSTGTRPAAAGRPVMPAKPPLTQNDFEYVGVIRVPQEISGYSVGAMTARKVDANVQFLMTGHRYADAVFEFIGLPPSPNAANAMRPNVLTAWGNQVYGGKRISWQERGALRAPSAWWTGALCWHDGRLLWTYYDGYNVSGFDDFVLGMTVLGAPGVVTAHGPWRTQASSHKACGWVIEIPAEFGDAYCNGARIGVGAGLTSGNVSSSWGTDLFALVPPTPATPAGYRSRTLPTTTLLSHDINHQQARDADYISHGSPDRPPNGGVGSWLQDDMLTGACWIDVPDKHGLLFAGVLGHGDVWYGPYTTASGVMDSCGLQITGPHSARRDPRWWIYDPADLARVATGATAPWDIHPSAIFDPRTIQSGLALGCPPAMAGMWFDQATRNLYVACPAADPQPYVQTPLIHVWHVK